MSAAWIVLIVVLWLVVLLLAVLVLGLMRRIDELERSAHPTAGRRQQPGEGSRSGTSAP